MEEKVMRQKSFPSEYLDDMLLASFLNDEYNELQEDVQENVFGFQDGANKDQCVEKDVQQNRCNLKEETMRLTVTNDSLSKTCCKTESIFEESTMVNVSKTEDERSNLSSDSNSSISTHTNKHMLEELNADKTVLRKIHVEVTETENVKDSEKNTSSTEGNANEKHHCDEYHLEELGAEGNTLTRRKTGILAKEQKATNCNEASNTNGPILQNGPVNTMESAKNSNSQDDNTQLQSDHAFANTEKRNYLDCKDNFIMSIKICFGILLFVSLVYYFLIQKR